MRETQRAGRLMRTSIAIAALVGLVVACGDDDDDDSSSTTAPSASTETTTAETTAAATTEVVATTEAGTAEAVATTAPEATEPAATTVDSTIAEGLQAALASVEEGYAGTDGPLPDAAPEPVQDLNLWIIACTLEGEGCARPAEAASDAAKELGWDVTIADGKLDPNEQANQMRAAIAAGADVIIPLSLSCEAVPAAFQEARDAGVKLYGLYSRDCPEPLLDAKIFYGEGIDDLAIEVVAPAVANYVIAKTDANAEVINMFFDDGGGGRDIGNAFESTFAANCPDCVVHNVPVTGQDIGQGKLQELTAAALVQYPDADTVMVPFDGLILLGVGAAVGEVEGTGRDILLTGFEGLAPSLEMIAAGGPQNLAAGSPAEWHGWAAIDGVIRLMAGEEQVHPGIGYQLIDMEHPSPAIPYNGNERSSGWKDNYREIWGLSG